MELLLVLCLCISTWTGKTLGDENDIPTLRATEDTDVILPCSPIGKDDLTHQVFDWKKDDTQGVFFYDRGNYYNNGKPGQNENFKIGVNIFQDQLQFGNASIHINNTKRTDSGNYSCEFPHLKPQGQKFYIQLIVECILKDRTLEKSTELDVCKKPTLRTEKTPDGIKVKCSVSDVLKVEMELHNTANESVGQLVHAGTSQNPQYFMFSVTKEDYYRCLVKQKEYCHQLYSEEVLVQIPGSSNAAVIGLAGFVGFVALGFILFLLRKQILDMCCPGREGKTAKSTVDESKDLTNPEERNPFNSDN